jgi:hypothetical protein
MKNLANQKKIQYKNFSEKIERHFGFGNAFVNKLLYLQIDFLNKLSFYFKGFFI